MNTIPATAKLLAPVAIKRDRQSERSEGARSVTGTVVRGALAAIYLQHHGRVDDTFRRLFLDEAACRFGPLDPGPNASARCGQVHLVRRFLFPVPAGQRIRIRRDDGRQRDPRSLRRRRAREPFQRRQNARRVRRIPAQSSHQEDRRPVLTLRERQRPRILQRDDGPQLGRQPDRCRLPIRRRTFAQQVDQGGIDVGGVHCGHENSACRLDGPNQIPKTSRIITIATHGSAPDLLT